MKLGLSVLFAAVVVPQIAALFVCGPIGIAQTLNCVFVAVLCMWSLWKHGPRWRRTHYLLCFAVLATLGALTWFSVPQLTFRQAQERVCALPENAAAQPVSQDWSQWLISSAPASATAYLLNRSYFVIVSEGDETRSYFVNPIHGTVYKNSQ